MSVSVIIAMGSNRRHGRFGTPANVLQAAAEALADHGVQPLCCSTVRPTAPMGPRQRGFANAVLVAATDLDPMALLAALKTIERDFGRRPGKSWGPRVLDLDLIAWDDRAWPNHHRWRTGHAGLAVPHRAMQSRRFVLDPLVEVAADWRHPILCRTARQLHARAHRPRPTD